MPAKVQDGGVIRGGFDAELDRLRSLSRDNMAWLAELEQAEQKRTGIRNLRIKYNGAFRVFHRGDQGEPRQRSARIHTPPDHGELRQVHYAGIARKGARNPPLAGVRARAGAGALFTDSGARAFLRACSCVGGGHSGAPRRFQGLGGNRARVGLLPPRCGRLRRHRNFGGTPPRRRTDAAPRQDRVGADGVFRPERRASFVFGGADCAHYGPQHGGEIHLHTPDSPHRADGADGLFRAGARVQDRAGRQDFQQGRRQRRARARQLDFHGRDERDRKHFEQLDRQVADNPRRNRARDEHLRRAEHRVGRRRVHTRRGARAARARCSQPTTTKSRSSNRPCRGSSTCA